MLNALSHRDLSVTITNDYSGSFGQIKDDANITVGKLKEILNQIKEAIDNINSGAKEIASGKRDLSHLTEEQVANMGQLTSTTQHHSANAIQAAQLAADAANIAGEGFEVASQVVVKMDEIIDSSRKIGAIIPVIDDIVLQAKMLAHTAAH